MVIVGGRRAHLEANNGRLHRIGAAAYIPQMIRCATCNGCGFSPSTVLAKSAVGNLEADGTSSLIETDPPGAQTPRALLPIPFPE
jgi:hypothetical protein